MATVSPLTFWVMERVSPSHVGKGGFAPLMRLATAIGLVGGLHVFYQRSCRRSISLSSSTLILTWLQSAFMGLRRTQGKSKWT